MPRGVATEPVVVRSRPAAARAARADGNSPTVSYAAGALLLALLLGGGGLAAAIARRRRDVPEPPTDRFAEMEAELQEILAEEKLRADKEARAREPA